MSKNKPAATLYLYEAKCRQTAGRRGIILEAHGIEYLVTAGSISLVVVIDALTVRHRSPGKVGNIDNWNAFADIMRNSSVAENI